MWPSKPATPRSRVPWKPSSRHMSSGRSAYRGGRALVTLLKEVRSTAAALDEWQVVRLVQDSLDYAEGRILRPDFEERYRNARPGQRPSHVASCGAVPRWRRGWSRS